MSATDDYAEYSTPPPGPCRNAAAVTPSDSADLGNVTRAIYVGGAGDLVVVTAAGQTVAISGVTAGSLLPLAVARIKETSTTATKITALW